MRYEMLLCKRAFIDATARWDVRLCTAHVVKLVLIAPQKMLTCAFDTKMIVDLFCPNVSKLC